MRPPGWVKLLDSAAYGGTWDAEYDPIRLGSFTKIKAVHRSGYVTCSTSSSVDGNPWQECALTRLSTRACVLQALRVPVWCVCCALFAVLRVCCVCCMGVRRRGGGLTRACAGGCVGGSPGVTQATTVAP